MNLAENLQKHRRRIGLSQEELAEKCFISRQAIAKWESGESTPTIDKLIFLADLFKVTLDELVGRKEDIVLFEEFIKRYVPSDLKLGQEDDTIAVVSRFFHFLDKYELTAKEKLDGMNEVFLAPENR